MITALAGITSNGVFTTKEAERAGVHRLALQGLRRHGMIHPLARGVWCLTLMDSEEDRHLVRAVAYLARMVRPTAVDGPTALLAHGLPLVGADLGTVHLVRAEQASTRRCAGYSLRGYHHTPVHTDRHPVLDHPVPAVPVPVAIVNAGLYAAPITGLAAADAALRLRLVTREAVERALEETPSGARGIAAVRGALRLADSRRESAGESLTALVCHQLGITLVPQVQIGRYRVDFVIEGTRVIVEFDGALKYESHDDLVAEKRREDDLRARGYVLVRLMWSDLQHPSRVRARIERALALAS